MTITKTLFIAFSLFLTACPNDKKDKKSGDEGAPEVPTGSPSPAGSSGTSTSKSTDGFNSLIAMTAEAAGNNCAYGGQKIQSGLDNGTGGGTARNGNLESGEVQATSYVCAQQSVPPRLIRVTTSNTVTLSAADVDAACVAEFGTSYTGATKLDTLFQLSNIMTHPYGLFAADGSVSVYNTGSYDDYSIWTITASTARAACVYVKSPLRFTRGTLPVGATLAQSSALCDTEFGSAYHLAHMWDVFGNKPPRIDYGGVFTADGYMSIQQTTQYGKYSIGQFGGSGPFPVACAMD